VTRPSFWLAAAALATFYVLLYLFDVIREDQPTR
jgi:hypothetical protein